VSTHQSATHGAKADYRIAPGSPWAGAWKIAGGIGIACLAVAAFGYTVDATRFAYSYLFGYFVSLSLALGSLFFVLVLYVTKAGWGVTVRRIAEIFMRPIIVFVVLAVPLVLMMPRLFPWIDAGAGHHEAAHVETPAEGGDHAGAQTEKKESPLAESRGMGEREPVALRDLPVAETKSMETAEEGAEAKIVAHKRPFLNVWFFLARLVLYMAIWVWLTHRYFNWSSTQDRTKAHALTAAAQDFAPVALMLFAVSLTFFGFDWLLSLDATWYSTMFGVFIFAQCALFQMASLIVVTLLLRRSGLLGNAVNVEHFHDMGKLLFGWIVFWSYIAFAQFFLTWYSNIPDEVAFFHKRWDDNGGTWLGVSLTLVAMHFFVPFWFMMSRNIKRRLPLLAAGSICMIVMHVVDVYWVVLPNYGPFAPNVFDAACLFGVLGVYLAAVLRIMTGHSLVAIGDPRLSRALEFENA
jgi:hypothetical protein